MKFMGLVSKISFLLLLHVAVDLVDFDSNNCVISF